MNIINQDKSDNIIIDTNSTGLGESLTSDKSTTDDTNLSEEVTNNSPNVIEPSSTKQMLETLMLQNSMLMELLNKQKTSK